MKRGGMYQRDAEPTVGCLFAAALVTSLAICTTIGAAALAIAKRAVAG